MRDRLAQDAASRERALDIRRSFIVQAPAGSGKTGLLIQRMLALLAHVDRPERIVAMTFTRKAAGEMRERIVEALANAAAPLTPSPADAHEQRTLELAQAALAQDRRFGWQLLAHPSRLAIDTIDAIAAGFARQAPVTAGLGALPRYVDDATDLYLEAARAALASAPADDRAWRALVAHDDNRADSIVALLADLIAKRDQWLSVTAEAAGERSRKALDATLAREIESELQRTRRALAEHADELAVQQRYASAHLDAGGDALLACAEAGGLPPPSVEALAHWKALADWLLLKSEPRVRQKVDRSCGFPAADKGSRARIAKEAMATLLRRLDAEPAIASALDVVRCLPTASIGDDAWAIVEALLALLPRVAAQLTVTFAERGRIDFVEGALAALRALGRADTPSDLLLRLDGAIHHLLIDEFQDTSVTQHAMIERLVAGWTPGDGRTLFAVGDPMQSIYRFRAAEVRLFVEAQERGRIGDVAVESLTLRRNFRAQANLVEWVNGAFPAVLGARNDPLRSIVAFADASAAKPAQKGIDVTFDALPDVGSEARTVVAHVQRALDEGDASVAILVRTRRHAEPLLPALREARIAFTAVELDSFAERPAIRDLTALTHALVQPADRLAWHALLRAPWCGLRLADLVAIAASDATRERALVTALTAPNEIAALSDDGRARLARIAEALVPALAARGQAPVAARVRGAWLAMGGPACIEDASDLEAAERYFALLAQAETAGDLTNWAAFTGTLARLREGDAPPDVRVRLMTLHRAKGLEFDTVVMPALARVGQKASTELLRWRRRREGLLIAPGTPRGGDVDPIYAYLGRLAADEESAELGRLLYVGCTRAKRRLHLTAAWRPRRDADAPSGWRWSAPASGSALAKLWPIVREALREPPIDAADTSARASSVLLRVPPAWRARVPDDMLDSPREIEAVEEAPAFDWVRETARHVGVVVHRVLAQIARDGLGSWPDTRIDALAPALALALSSEGVDAPELADAVSHATRALASVLADPRGRWLFDPSHSEARSEWALAGVDAGALVHRTLDRTFVDRGVRWIVDFKTGRHEGGDVDAFLDAERERYAPSLETYARLVRALDPGPIRLALYHPLVRGWREWDFDG